MLNRFNDIIRKIQIPLTAAWLIWVGWTGDLGVSIAAFDKYMAQFDKAVMGGATYPSLFIFSVGIVASWSCYAVWARRTAAREPLTREEG